MEHVILNDYRPTKKAEEFHASNAFVTVLVGGMGSGKSRAMIEEIRLSALQWPGIPMAMYRKTMPSLRDSTLHEFMSIIPPELGRYWAREDSWECINKSFCNFRGLDDPNKAKSTEYALIVMEEADEFTYEDFLFLKDRVRKKGPWPLRIILCLNPCDEDHWIYKQFVTNAREWEESGGLKVIHFSTYDNVDNLPPGYIEKASAGRTKEEIDRYINGMWGSIVKGTPVYKDTLTEFHLRKFDIKECVMLLRGWDFGFNHPACSFRLVDAQGRHNCAHSMMGEKIDLDIFAPQVLVRTQALYPGLIVRDFGDPRGHDKGPSAKQTCFEILQDFGIHAIGERGSQSYVLDGIRKVRKRLNSMTGGVPNLTIDPGNSLIRSAYYSKYIRDETGYPVKDGYFEHIADADRYIDHHDQAFSAVDEAIRKAREKRALKEFVNPYTGYRRK